MSTAATTSLIRMSKLKSIYKTWQDASFTDRISRQIHGSGCATATDDHRASVETSNFPIAPGRKVVCVKFLVSNKTSAAFPAAQAQQSRLSGHRNQHPAPKGPIQMLRPRLHLHFQYPGGTVATRKLLALLALIRAFSTFTILPLIDRAARAHSSLPPSLDLTSITILLLDLPFEILPLQTILIVRHYHA